MGKTVTRRLADDIRASLREARDHAAGKRTRAIVHKVTPRATDAREARGKLGLSHREQAHRDNAGGRMVDSFAKRVEI
jgi:hypothetical protein